MNLSECNITGLTPGVTYYYRVCVSNNGGQNCKTGSIATKLNPPTLSNITATSTYNSINLSYTMSGTVSSRTCKYGTTNGNYSYTVSNPTNSKCSITGLAENTTYYYQVCASNNGGQNCKTGSIKTGIRLSSLVKVGDYVRMTPTATSYSIPTSTTGYTSAQTINPSELNLWRVIKVDTDGTIEMVSDKVSSVPVYFRGKEGYMNLVGGLNTIAAQYTDGKHVLRTRHMGYSTQKEKCSGPLLYQNPGDCGSDTGYQTDTNLVESVVGSLVANKAGTTTAEPYWLASRLFGIGNGYRGRYVGPKSGVSGNYLYHVDSDGTGNPYSWQYAVRPIVTLKSTSEKLSGSGTSSSPYTL